MSRPDFDHAASTYQETLDRGLRVSGEDSMHFARRRVEWLAGRLSRIGAPRARAVLDFGCGTGATTALLLDTLGAARVVGVDTSATSLDIARRANRSPSIELAALDGFPRKPAFDVAYSNGVFHHVAPRERDAAVAFVEACLVPGGVFALFENNPWNPGTRYVMWRLPFDRNAQPLRAREGVRLVRRAGLEVLHVDYLFVFPRVLSALRVLEPSVAAWPLGAQYLVLSRKPR